MKNEINKIFKTRKMGIKNFYKGITKILSIMLALVIAIHATIPVFAASPFSYREIYGYEGQVFLTTKENAVLRKEPHNKGKIIDELPQGYPLESEFMIQTDKGTKWIKVKNPDNEDMWCYLGSLAVHTHNFVDLESLGYGGFEFCDGCGHVRAKNLQSFEVRLENASIGLAFLSLLPVVGNGFDVLDALVCLTVGDYAGAIVSFGSAIPGLGAVGNIAKVGDVFSVSSRTQTLVATLDYVDGYTDIVKVRPLADYNKLKRQMAKMYDLTGDLRFKKLTGENIPKRSVAAHHIVAIGEKASEEAANILMYLQIDLNGASNAVWLCSKANVCGGTLHYTRHSEEYYLTVNQMISKAYNKSSNWAEQRVEVLKELDKIARQLMAGKLSL